MNNLAQPDQTRTRPIAKPCKCNSCVFLPRKQEGEFIRNGNKVDSLYFDKYLPLRERKLIDKLVRTRSLYDEVRNEILSLSSVDIPQDRKFEEPQPEGHETDSRVVHEFVDLVDRGEYPGHHSPVHLHSECCGCCVCNSKTRIQTPKVHMHIPEPEHIDRYVESHRGKMPKETKKVAFKGAKSESCMCTLKFSTVPKSKRVGQNYRPKAVTATNTADEKKKKADKRHKNVSTCDCPFEVAKPSLSRRSIVMLKNAEQKMRTSIRSTITKIENAFHVKKDSLTIFRDKLKRKEEHKALLDQEDFYDEKYRPFLRECEPLMCIPGKCDPRDCLKILIERSPATLKRSINTQPLQKPKVKKNQVKVICGCESISTQTKNKKSRPESEIKATQSVKMASVVERKPHDLLPYECEPTFCVPEKCNPYVCDERIKERNQKNKRSLKRSFNTQQLQTTYKKDQDSLQKPENEKANVKSSKTETKKGKIKSGDKEIKERIICRCASMSTQTKKKSHPESSRNETRNVEAESIVERKPHNLLPCDCKDIYCVPDNCDQEVCEGKIKKCNMKTSYRKNKIMSKDTNTLDSDKAIQTPIHKKRRAKPDTSIAEKSVSSPNAPRRQVVRISSSFSFNIEFFKEVNYPEDEQREKSVEDNMERFKDSKSTSEVKVNDQKELKHNVSITPKPPSKDNNQVSHDTLLRRCLCTLKLHKIHKQKSKQKRPKSKMTMTQSKSKIVVDECACEPDIIPNKQSKQEKPKKKMKPTKKTMTVSEEKVETVVKEMSIQTKKTKPPPVQKPVQPCECECDVLVQTKKIKVKSRKEDDKEPLLKRCFCTLKLHSDHDTKQSQIIPIQTEVIKTKSVASDTPKIKPQKKDIKLTKKPHMIRAVCKCDKPQTKKTYCKCDMKEAKSSNTVKPKRKSRYSGPMPKPEPQQRHVKRDRVHEDVRAERPQDTAVSPNEHRQSVKLGSEFSFHIEFYKSKLQNEVLQSENSKRSKLFSRAHQIYFVNNKVSGFFLKDYVRPRECTPCLCIAAKHNNI